MAVRLIPSGPLATIDLMLSYMQRHGSSVSLSWGEDDGAWECSWITDGRRYTNFSEDAQVAVRVTLQKGTDDARS